MNSVIEVLRGDLFAFFPLMFEGYTSVEILFWGIVLFSGALGGIGGVYLLYVDTIVVHYTSFFKIITLGMFVFVLTAPIVFFLAVDFIHGIHGFAALVIAVGLYTLYRDEIRTDHGFESEIPEFRRSDDETPEFTRDDD